MSDHEFTVVGGGTGALGRAVVDRLLGEGRRVIVPTRSEDAALPAGVTVIKCDISDAADVERFEAEVAGLGTWRALVNASGGFAAGAAHTTSDAKMMQQLELNFLGQWRLARAAARAMTAAGSGGRIVNVVGRAGVEAAPRQAAYQVAKTALARLTQVMALELGDQGITVNAVLPSTMDTPKNRTAFTSADSSRWVPVADVAATIAWLLSDEAAIVSGALLPVYGRA